MIYNNFIMKTVTGEGFRISCAPDARIALAFSGGRDSVALFELLREAGAEAHMTLFDRMEDLTGTYHEPDGSPLHIAGHNVWIHVYNDFCIYDMDGTRVFQDGMPVSLWQWMALQHK